jgi:hypothetical protein
VIQTNHRGRALNWFVCADGAHKHINIHEGLIALVPYAVLVEFLDHRDVIRALWLALRCTSAFTKG